MLLSRIARSGWSVIISTIFIFENNTVNVFFVAFAFDDHTINVILFKCSQSENNYCGCICFQELYDPCSADENVMGMFSLRII
jgi:hypothetical protein